MKKYVLPVVCAVSILAGSPQAVRADDHASKEERVVGTYVTLSASDQKKVDQDLLVASLRIELDNKDSRKLQGEINKAMRKAVDIAKADASIKVSTGNYYVYSYDPNPSPQPLSLAEQKKRMVWKGSQTLDLQSKDAQKILDVLGQIQEQGFVMNNLGYTLSPELAESQKDELLVGALNKIKAKADLMVRTLGKKGYEIVEINVDGSYMPQPQPVMMKAMRMEMDSVAGSAASAPVAEPSETEVGLSVSARILLKP